MENKEQKGIFVKIYDWFKNLTVKGLLGAILIAFIIIILIMSASHIPGVISRISSSLSAALYSIFVPAENATIVTDRKIINSGEDFTISFKKGDLTNGIFTVSYSCDLEANLVSVETNGLKTINCDTPYYLLDDENSIKIKATTVDSIVRLAITGAFENNDNQKSESVGVVRVTIKNSSTGTIIDTPTSTPSTIPNTDPVSPIKPPVNPPTNTVYYGKPDLVARVIQVGSMGQGVNLINSQNRFVYSDTVGIKFEIRNDGDANTGPWSFTAVLPSLSTPNYNSNTQISLRPGESIIFTLGFSNLSNTRDGLITINVDPQNMVSESAEYNNIITSTITNSSYNSDYYDNYYGTGCYINGVYSRNCYNYYDYYDYYDYDDYSDLRVSCYASPTDPETGNRVRWYARASGGDGDYDYEWSGTNSLDGTSRSISKTYNSRGWKYATVTVESDGYAIEQTCSVYVN